MVAQIGLSAGEQGGVVGPSRTEDGPGSVFARAGEWFVLHTRTHQEKALGLALGARGVGYFLPMHRAVRFQGRRKLVVDTPLFSNYLFLKGSLEDAYAADRTGRVANILRCPDQARMEWELGNVWRALAGNADLQPYPYLKQGLLAEVRSGPFRGVQGLIQERGKGDRLVLQIQTLGRAVSFEVDGSLLDVVR